MASLRLKTRTSNAGLFAVLLLSLVATFPALAMQPLDEIQMAGVTGRDGVTIKIDSPAMGWSQAIYDRDGVPADGGGVASVLGIDSALTPGEAGAILFNDFRLNLAAPMVITMDAGQSTSGKPIANIGITIPHGTTFHVSDLQLAAAPNNSCTSNCWATTNVTTALSSNGGAGYDLTFGGSSNQDSVINLQLGNVAQSFTYYDPVTSSNKTVNPLLLADISLKDGWHITNYEQGDSSTGYALALGELVVDNNTGDALSTSTSKQDLTVKDLAMNVTDDGLVFAVGQLGDVTNGLNIQMNDVHLGDSSLPGLGNTYIRGLNLGSDATLTISGH